MEIEYEVRVLPRAKRLTLSIQKNGKVRVTVPRLTPRFFIDQFVKKSEPWILETQQKKAQKTAEFVSETSLMLFGKTYAIEVKSTPSASKIALQGTSLQILLHNAPAKSLTFDPEHFPPVLTRFFQQTATHYITQRTATLAEKMKVSYISLQFKTMKTRWGSCSSRGNLNFNWKLVHFPPNIIDSVIVHELAHRTHMNHSVQFWNTVEKYDPEYRIHRGWLKRQGSQID